jgi:hypothetical protein
VDFGLKDKEKAKYESMFVPHVFLDIFDFHSEFESEALDLLVLVPEGATVISEIIGPLPVLIDCRLDKVVQALYFLFHILVDSTQFFLHKSFPQHFGEIYCFLMITKKILWPLALKHEYDV